MQDTHQAFFQGIHDDPARSIGPGARHGAQQMVELAFDGGKVVKYVGVVELEVVQDDSPGPVMHKLAAFIKECRVVLVSFDDKQFTPAARNAAAAEPRGAVEIHRHATNQVSRCESGPVQNPGQHGGCGGFSMRARYRQHMAALQHMFGQPLRATGIRSARVQDGFHQRVARIAVGTAGTADHIADHKKVGMQGELVSTITLHDVDSQIAQLLTHRRVDGQITPGDPVTLGPRQRRQPPHEGSADAQDMKVHAEILGEPRGTGTHAKYPSICTAAQSATKSPPLRHD